MKKLVAMFFLIFSALAALSACGGRDDCDPKFCNSGYSMSGR